MKHFFISVLIGSTFFTSCRTFVEGGSGNMTTEYRQEPAFNSIHIMGNINVYVTQDSSYSVRVEAGENMIGYIETNVVNNEMIIYEANNNIANTKPIRVYVNADSLENVILEGSGNFDADNILADVLNILISGSGNVNMDLTANQVNFNLKGSGDGNLLGNTVGMNALIQGSGDLSARFLQAQDVVVSVEGSGDAVVTASNSIVASVSGSGDIRYYGNPPSVSTSTSGSGTISGN